MRSVSGILYLENSWKLVLWSWPQLSDWAFFNCSATFVVVHYTALTIQNRQVCSNWSCLWCRKWICMSQSQLNSCCLDFLRLDGQSVAASLKLYTSIIWDSGCSSNELMTYCTPPLLFHLKPSVPPVTILSFPAHACAATLVFVVVNNILWGLELQSQEESYSGAQGHFLRRHFGWG